MFYHSKGSEIDYRYKIEEKWSLLDINIRTYIIFEA